MSSAQKKKLKQEEKRLLRQPIGGAERIEWKKEYHTGSDRSVAIIAAANLEAYLEQLITMRLKNNDDKTMDRLLDRGGPLSSFHMKIELAYAMGLVTVIDRGELHQVRAIRNDFAHTPSLIKFTTPRIKRETMKLKFRGRMPKELKEHYRSDLVTAREHFVLVVMTFQGELMKKMTKTYKARLDRAENTRTALVKALKMKQQK